MRPVLLACLLLNTGAAAGPGSAVGQVRETVISEGPTCEGCKIEISHIARLGETRGDGLIDDDILSVLVTGQDHVFVFPGRGVPPLVFTLDGRFVGRPGRIGGGPGEYRWPSGGVDLGDGRVMILDADQARATVVGPGLRYESSSAITGVFSGGFSVDDQNFVLAGSIPTKDRYGQPLHLWSPGEGSFRSFGASEEPVLSPSQLVRRVWPSPAGGTWSLPKLQYRIEEWSPSGDLLQTITRKVDWFPEVSKAFSGNPREPPWPRLKAIKQDPEGLLWIVAWVPSGSWKEAWRDVTIRGTETTGGGPSHNELFSSRIEVIDPVKGEVLVSQRWRGLPVDFGPNGVMATTYQDLSGHIFVDLWKVSLDRTQKGGME